MASSELGLTSIALLIEVSDCGRCACARCSSALTARATAGTRSRYAIADTVQDTLSVPSAAAGQLANVVHRGVPAGGVAPLRGQQQPPPVRAQLFTLRCRIRARQDEVVGADRQVATGELLAHHHEHRVGRATRGGTI